MMCVIFKMDFLQRLMVITIALSYANGQGRGALRLVINNQVLSTSQSAGIVQVYYNNFWGNICDDTHTGISSSEADVVCHQLGFSGVSTYGSAARLGSAIYGTDRSTTAIEDVSCSSGNYLALLSQCSFRFRYSSFCTNNDTTDLYVTCYTSRIWDSPYAGQIRLVDGTYSNQGRLEVYCNGQWGTVCDRNFFSTAATVACRQLGYNTYDSYGRISSSSSLVASSTQPIWLDNLYAGDCRSSSSCLAYCQTCPLAQTINCGHDRDVELECESASFRSLINTTLSTCQLPLRSSFGTAIGVLISSLVLLLIIAGLIIGISVCICLKAKSGSSVKSTTVFSNIPATSNIPPTHTPHYY